MKSFIISKSLLLALALCLQFLVIKLVKDNLDRNQALNLIHNQGITVSTGTTSKLPANLSYQNTEETAVAEPGYVTAR